MTDPVDDFCEWKRQSEDKLNAHQEYARQVIRRDVTHSMQTMMAGGVSFDDAGDILDKRFMWGLRDGVNYTPDAVRNVLLEIGWQPKQARSKRGAA